MGCDCHAMTGLQRLLTGFTLEITMGESAGGLIELNLCVNSTHEIICADLVVHGRKLGREKP